MNWVGEGSRTLRGHVTAYDGTSELPFLRLGDSSVFLAVRGRVSVRQRVEPVTTTSGERHQWGGRCGALRCLILALLSLEQNNEKKNNETKIGTIEYHDQTMCKVLEGGREVFERKNGKSAKILCMGS